MFRFIVLVLSAFFLIPTIAFAATKHSEFNKNGYQISVYYNQKRDTLEVNGYIKDGKSCKQLNVDIFFRNSEDGHKGHIAFPLNNYKPHGRKYKSSDKIYSKHKNKSDWYVDSIYTKCLN